MKHGNIWKPGVVLRAHKTPRSYIIKTDDGTVLRRNRRHLRQTKEVTTTLRNSNIDDDVGDTVVNDTPKATSDQPSSALPLTDISGTRSRYGRIIRPPLRYGDQVV